MRAWVVLQVSHAFGLSQQGEREADLLYTSRRSITDPVTGVYCRIPLINTVILPVTVSSLSWSRVFV